VIVDFLEGNPNKPIIIGRVYHGDNQPPYTLPDDKTKSTIKSDSSKGGGGSNEIRFEDLKGSEEIYTHAQKDQNEVVENNMSTSVGNDQSLTVGHDRTKTVKHDEKTTIENDRTQTVNGTHTEWIKKDTMITVAEGNYIHEVNTGTGTSYVKDDVTETYDASQTTTVNKDITITASTGKIHITAATEIKLEVGASSMLLKSDGSISIDGMSIAINGIQSVDVHAMSVTSQADVDHNIRGAIVLSEASGANTIKGAMVMLNP
jgi:type VI secretion system secreted protein VgrG